MDASHALEAQVSAETTHRRSSAAMMVEGNLSCQRDVYQTGTDVHSAHSFYTGQPISQGALFTFSSFATWSFFRCRYEYSPLLFSLIGDLGPY